MTGEAVPDETDPDTGPHRRVLPWEFPEIAAVAILVLVAILAAGGLATGIARAVKFGDTVFPGAGDQITWNAISFGAQWASPFVAALLLAVTGLCWWQLQAWSELLETPADGDDVSDARDHIRRSLGILLFVRAGLLLTAAGSIASFVADVGQSAGGSGPDWTFEIYYAASTLAVFVILSAALYTGWQFDRQYGRGAAVVDRSG